MADRGIDAVGSALNVALAVALLLAPGCASSPPRLSATELYRKGNTFAAESDYRLAISAYDAAITQNGRYVDAYLARAAAYGEIGKLDQALLDYNKAVELAPRDADAYALRGVCHHRQGETDRSLADFDRAIALNPSCARAYMGRGTVRLALGNDLDGSISDLRKAADLDSSLAPAYESLGAAYLQKNDASQAVRYFDAAIRLEPSYAYTYYRKARACEQAGRTDEAVAAYRRFIDLTPANDPDRSDALARINALRQQP